MLESGAGFPLLSFDPLLSFRPISQGVWLPRNFLGGDWLPIGFGPTFLAQKAQWQFLGFSKIFISLEKCGKFADEHALKSNFYPFWRLFWNSSKLNIFIIFLSIPQSSRPKGLHNSNFYKGALSQNFPIIGDKFLPNWLIFTHLLYICFWRLFLEFQAHQENVEKLFKVLCEDHQVLFLKKTVFNFS